MLENINKHVSGSQIKPTLYSSWRFFKLQNRTEVIQNKSGLLLKINLQNTQTLQLLTMDI